MDHDLRQPLPSSGRVVKSPASVEPLYPEARLIKGAVLEADRLLEIATQREQASHETAQSIIRTAHEDAQRIRTEAAARASVEVRQVMGKLLVSLEAQIAEQRQKFSQLVPRAAMDLARTVVRAELTANPQQMVRLVEEVGEQARRYENLTIRLHPDDAVIVSAQMEALRESLPFAKQIQVLADATVPRFEIRLDTEMGRYIGGLETALARLEAHLFGGQSKQGAS
jgi:flagellar biosynthesis/type III secretory pathway protein FliH